MICQKIMLGLYQVNKGLFKKWSFPLRISSVNMTKIAEEILVGKLYFLCSENILVENENVKKDHKLFQTKLLTFFPWNYYISMFFLKLILLALISFLSFCSSYNLNSKKSDFSEKHYQMLCKKYFQKYLCSLLKIGVKSDQNLIPNW